MIDKVSLINSTESLISNANKQQIDGVLFNFTDENQRQMNERAFIISNQQLKTNE